MRYALLIFVKPDSYDGLTDADPIARRLGVDLVEPDELEAAAARYGAPLPASLVP